MDTLYTLDEATSSNDILFMERASAGVIAQNIAAGDFRSAVGARFVQRQALDRRLSNRTRFGR